MTDATSQGTPAGTPSERRSASAIFRSFEVDSRLLGMIITLLVLWVVFDVASNGLFLSPRNLWNLSVQTSAVAVMATGMVLIIVSRNIDLSVGSLVGVIGMAMALLMARWIPNSLGLGFEQPYAWIVAVVFGLVLGAALGGLTGVLVAYVGIPSFVVTLGGLLVWRSVAIILSSGQTIAQLDPTFVLLGGGPEGSAGETVSWIIGLAVCVAIAYALFSNRRRRERYGFPVRAWWADATLGILGCGVVLWAVWVANSYPWPKALATEFAVANGITEPPGGLLISTGIAYPVLLALGVGALMTVLATRRRTGRYIYAIGGNPDAALLSGINTRRIILMTFVIMGVLAAVSSIILTARGQSATSGSGTGAGSPGHRGRGHWWDVVRWWHRYHPRRDPGGAHHPVARHGHAAPEMGQFLCADRGRPRAGHRGGHRHRGPEAREMSLDQTTMVVPVAPPASRTPLVEMRDIRVSFGGVHAVDGVSVDLYPGEVVGLVGGNGAGKSTLIRTLSGARPPDGGQICINGEPVQIRNPHDAKAYGIETIYQTLALADNVDAAANIFLGRELVTRFGSLNDAAMESATRKVMGRLNPRFKNFKTPVKTLSGGQRQSVAIARAVHFNAKILIMDEPTAALGPAETAQVRDLVSQLKDEGIGIFLISHDIHDVFDLADRISVMLQGKLVGTVDKNKVTKDEVLGMIIIGKLPEEVDSEELAALH